VSAIGRNRFFAVSGLLNVFAHAQSHSRPARTLTFVRQYPLRVRVGVARRAEDEQMGDILQPWHLIVLAVVAFLLFGAKRLPELGKGLGEGLKGFKEGIRGGSDPVPPAPPVQQSAAAPPPPPVSAPVEPQIVRKD
jgi:sec-independent protein translocase protein TatA